MLRQIPSQLAKENKKFQISKVARGARFKDYRGCIDRLCDAGTVKICHCLHFPELPLKGNYDGGKFKLYFADTGLLVAMLDEEAQEDLRANRNLGVYKGALYENMAAEALTKCGMGLYYYKREDSTLEKDFFVRTRRSLLPLEVKATRGTAKSLRTLIGSKKYPDIELVYNFRWQGRHRLNRYRVRVENGALQRGLFRPYPDIAVFLCLSVETVFAGVRILSRWGGFWAGGADNFWADGTGKF